MKKPSFLNGFLGLLVVMVYAFMGYIEFIAQADKFGLMNIIRHVILVAGLIPACSWLVVIFWSNKTNLGGLILIATLVTIYHWYVFAVSAHSDGLYYWSVQLIEIFIFLFIIRKIRKGVASSP